MSGKQRTKTDVLDAQWLARTLGRPRAFPLTSTDLELLARRLRSVSLPEGRTLFEAGTSPSGVWAVRAGAVELVQRSDEREHCVRVLRHGETVGDVEILQGHPARFTARTVQAAELLYMSAADFSSALSQSATLALRWASKLALQVGRNRERLSELLPSSLSERVARLLVDHAAKQPLELPQSTIARMLGVNRSPLNQALKELERARLIRVGYRRIEVLDVAALAETAGLGPVGRPRSRRT